MPTAFGRSRGGHVPDRRGHLGKLGLKITMVPEPASGTLLGLRPGGRLVTVPEPADKVQGGAQPFLIQRWDSTDSHILTRTFMVAIMLPL